MHHRRLDDNRKNDITNEKKEKDEIPSNYRPKTCLPTTIKLMTAIITESMLNHLANNGLDHS